MFLCSDWSAFLDLRLVKMGVSALPLLLLLQLPVNHKAQEVLLQDSKYGRPQGEASSCSWTCVLLTLQWPAAFCQVSVAERQPEEQAELKRCPSSLRSRWTTDVSATFPRASAAGPSTACGKAVT